MRFGKGIEMSKDLKKFVPFSVPADLHERTAAIARRVESDEAMTMQYIADSIGLPFEFVAVCIGLSLALKTGKPVLIDPAELPKTN